MDPNKIEYIRSVFMDLCPKYAEWLVKKDILLQWILHFDQHSGDDKKLQEMIPRKEHREYLKAAFCHFQLREHLICITGDRGSGPEQGYEFALTNSRYGFKLKASGEKFQSLEAMDFFTGHKRSFPLLAPTSPEINAQSRIRLFPIDLKRVFLIEHLDFSNRLYLIEINKNGCCVLDQMELNIARYENIFFVFDKLNHEKCVIVASGNIDRERLIDDITVVEIKENRLHSWISASTIDNYFVCSYRLEGNLLSGIVQTYLPGYGSERTVDYWELELDRERGNEMERKFEFKFPSEFRFYDPWQLEHSWIGNTCYISLPHPYNGRYMSSIFAFNVDTKECSIIDSECPTIERMQGDEKEVLSFRHEDSIYRLPLRRPEPLRNIAWFATKRRNDRIDVKSTKELSNQLAQNNEFCPFFHFC